MSKNKTTASAQAVTSVYYIPRFAFIWLLAAVAAVILPHALRMPPWLIGICALCIVGRILIFQGRMSYPSKKLKTMLVCLMVILVVGQYGRDLFSTDATVGVLLTGITLKLLEMQRKRDVLLVLYLCYFTVIAEFIYSQSIPIAVYMALVVVLITSALMSLNQNQQYQSPWRTFKVSGTILLQSIPLMLAIFVLFPRISPLWSVPLQTSSGRTGLSENMSPGDIGNLARSADVAFRVKFAGTVPAYNELYWRGITLDEFDGKAWGRGFSVEPQFLGSRADTRRTWYEAISYLGDVVDYNVILEPNSQNWIFTLQMPQMRDDRMMMRTDYQIESIRRITQRYSYDARSFLNYAAEVGVDEREQRRARILSRNNNNNSRAYDYAASLRAESASDEAYITAVMNKFREEEFYYTLSPPTLGDNPVDEFLFDTRSGFCEHYASAFTFLMRAAGIPARVVTGYMGGEYNPYDGTLTVRQYDAHAWSEVWLPEQGWVRLDPTGMVAPQRIEQGSDATLQEDDQFLDDEVFALVRFRNSLLLNELRYRLEMIDYAWNRFVLNYDQDMQFRFFSRLFGDVTKTKILLAVGGFMALVISLIAFNLFRSSVVANKVPATRLYLEFCKALAKAGFVRRTGETPQQFMHRVLSQNPQWRAELEDITACYTQLVYINKDMPADQVKVLRGKIRRFKLLS